MEIYYEFNERDYWYEVDQKDAFERIIDECFNSVDDYHYYVKNVLGLVKVETLKFWFKDEMLFGENETKDEIITKIANAYLNEWLTPKEAIKTMILELDIDDEFIRYFDDLIKEMFYDKAQKEYDDMYGYSPFSEI